LNSPGILRRLAAALYDALLLLAVLFVAALVFILVFGSAVEPPRRHFFQAYLLTIIGTYFIWFWTHGGQTLAMKTWRIRLHLVNGDRIALKTALLRFVIAFAGLAFFGAGWWWMLFDREHCPLHDRLTGTRLLLN